MPALSAARPGLSPELEHWRRQVLALSGRGLRKLAMNADGSGADTPFELAFSNLTHAYLSDRAPGLMPYEVGFQLLEKNEEGTRAVGVVGFKVGSQWMYVPVFFLNGELKGHELLYLRSQDTFVPLQEEWLNYLLGRKPHVLGKPVGRQSSRMGMVPPDLSSFKRPPSQYSKSGVLAPPPAGPMAGGAPVPPRLGGVPPAARAPALNPAANPNASHPTRLPGAAGLPQAGAPPASPAGPMAGGVPGRAQVLRQWLAGRNVPKAAADLRAGAAAMAHAALVPPAAEPAVSLEAFLKTAGLDTLETLATWLRDDPDLAMAYGRFYGPTLLKEALAAQRRPATPPAGVLAAPPAEKQAASRPGVVVVVTFEAVRRRRASDAERRRVLTEGVALRDERPDGETTRAYPVPVREQLATQLTNPTETGIYDVLTSDGRFRRSLVLLGPLDGRTARPFAVVVPTDEKAAWLNADPSAVFVRPLREQGKPGAREAYRDFVAGLPAFDGVPADDGRYLVLDEAGKGTCVWSRSGPVVVGEAGQESARITTHTWVEVKRPGYLGRVAADKPGRSSLDGDYRGSSPSIRFTNRDGGRLTNLHGELTAPKGYKLLKLSGDDEAEDCGCGSGPGFESLRLGSAADLWRALRDKAAAELVVSSDGLGYRLDGSRRLSRPEALVALVAGHGLREGAARGVLEKAAAERVARFWLDKKADPYLMPGPGAPGFPDAPTGPSGYFGGREAQFPLQEQLDVGLPRRDMVPYQDGPPEPDQGAIQAAIQAAQTGQKEVFDTAMVGGLLRATQSDNMVDRNLPDLMRGLDKLGRILFSYYWHGDTFADRYGKGDMAELEDSLRNAFDHLGRLILFLKQRSVEPSADEGSEGLLDNTGDL